jgi:hypothetical protein
MNSKLKMVLMLVSLIGLVLGAGLAMQGCATIQPGQSFHATISVSAPTPLLTGPARGHWAEQNEHAVITYTVLGTDCTYLSAQAEAPQFESHGTFVLGPGTTLCAIPLRDEGQKVLVHAERP